MGLEIPLILFAIFGVAVILTVLSASVVGWKQMRRPFYRSASWTEAIGGLLTLFFVVVANVGWWGGWITLIIWGVQTLA